MRDFGLVWRVGCHELAAAGELAHDGGYVMPVRARAEEAGVLAGRLVHGCKLGEVAAQVELGHRRRQVERGVAVPLGDVGEKLVHGVNADGVEHPASVGVGVGGVWGSEGHGTRNNRMYRIERILGLGFEHGLVFVVRH